MLRQLQKIVGLITLIWLLFPIRQLQAGGGPIEVRLSNVQGYINHKVKFDVYFHSTKPDEILAQTMYLYLVDPKDGRSCQLDSNRTDNTGKVSGWCTSSVVGETKFYVHWMEGGRSSEDATIVFVVQPPASPSPAASSKPTASTSPAASALSEPLVTPSPTIAPPSLSPTPTPTSIPTLTPTPTSTSTPAPLTADTTIATPASAADATPTTAKTFMIENITWIALVLTSFILGMILPIAIYWWHRHRNFADQNNFDTQNELTN